jgi:hypothetical protein
MGRARLLAGVRGPSRNARKELFPQRTSQFDAVDGAGQVRTT